MIITWDYDEEADVLQPSELTADHRPQTAAVISMVGCPPSAVFPLRGLASSY
jgi:hypothetical protein